MATTKIQKIMTQPIVRSRSLSCLPFSLSPERLTPASRFLVVVLFPAGRWDVGE